MTTKKHAVYGILALVSLLGLGMTQSAKATPVLGAGFSGDTIFARFADSAGSPYAINFAFATTFSITDAFIVGDIYTVYDFGTLILTTSVMGPGAPFGTPGDPTGEAAWENGAFGRGSILLAPGAHLLTFQGNCGGGCPAEFFTRIDAAVPDAGSTLPLLGFALAGVAVLRRKLRC
jgi:hypothetical protein